MIIAASIAWIITIASQLRNFSWSLIWPGFIATLFSYCCRISISGSVYSTDSCSRNHKDMVTDVLVCISAERRHHEAILEYLELFSIKAEVRFDFLNYFTDYNDVI